MLHLMKKRQRGFTLIELLIVVAIIGIIAAVLVPNFLDSLQKAKQKRTLADMRITGGAMMAWLTDQFAAAAAGAATTVDMSQWTGTSDISTIRSALVPQYVQEVPALDGWNYSFQYKLDVANPSGDAVMLVSSGGRDGSTVSGTYTVGGFEPTDYSQDLIWADGEFLRKPQ